jgi:hypothetical protein
MAGILHNQASTPSPMRFGFRHGRGREHQHDRDGVGARPPTVATPSASALRRESSLDRRRGLATDHLPLWALGVIHQGG